MLPHYRKLVETGYYVLAYFCMQIKYKTEIKYTKTESKLQRHELLIQHNCFKPLSSKSFTEQTPQLPHKVFNKTLSFLPSSVQLEMVRPARLYTRYKKISVTLIILQLIFVKIQNTVDSATENTPKLSYNNKINLLKFLTRC